MTVDEAKNALLKAGHAIKGEVRLPNGTGWKLTLGGDQIVNVYDSGKHHVGGKNPDAVRDLLGTGAGRPAGRKVFVVYGHDETALTQLEAMLHRWDLEPLVLLRLPSEGKTVIEKLERYQEDVDFGVVLATPDDQGHVAGKPSEKMFRARQNVVLELGMLLARLGRSRVAILMKRPCQMERPSDIQGLLYINFNEDVAETALPLIRELSQQGIQIAPKSL